VAQEFAVSIVQGQLDTAKIPQPNAFQVTAQNLQHADLDRIAWRDLDAADGVGTFKG
jgi:hypothetical protein